MRRNFRVFSLTSLGLALAACSTAAVRDRASADGNVVATAEALPRPEPRSRYGNPQFYDQMGRRYYVLDTAGDYAERGVASWYGGKFHGRRTSSGERYDMHAMTAAHKTLPLPTWVEVENLRNGKTVLVRINDRGPFVENRIIDLSYEAARRLDIIEDGTGLVEVRALSFDGQRRDTPVIAARSASEPAEVLPAEDLAGATASQLDDARGNGSGEQATAAEMPLPKLYAQIGAFSERSNAAGLHLRLQQTGFEQALIHEDRFESPRFYRVRIGPIAKVEQYDELVRRLRSYGIANVNMIID